MLTSKDFTDSDEDYEGHGYAAEIAQLATRPFRPIGEHCKHRSDEVEVVWLKTKLFDKPTDEWLSEKFPSPSDCVAGFKLAFAEYHDHWCGRQMRTAILAKLKGQERDIFEAEGWIPFVSIRSISINADANVISFGCSTVYKLDSNLDEHGVCIMSLDGKWKFGYACEDMHYFDNWKNP